MLRTERTAAEWFEEARRCYLERHQGCPWCGGSHRVHEVKRHARIEFYCSACDFQASYDTASGRFTSVPGEVHSRDKPDAMYEI